MECISILTVWLISTIANALEYLGATVLSTFIDTHIHNSGRGTAVITQKLGSERYIVLIKVTQLDSGE